MGERATSRGEEASRKSVNILRPVGTLQCCSHKQLYFLLHKALIYIIQLYLVLSFYCTDTSSTVKLRGSSTPDE